MLGLAAALLVVLAAGATPLLAQGAASDIDGKVYRDWRVRCETAEDGNQHCEIVQNVVNNQNNQRIMQVAVGYPPGQTEPVAVFILPLGVLLPPGAELSVDEGKATPFPILVCQQDGCLAELPLTTALLSEFRKGAKGLVVLQDPGQRKIGVPISLLGFTDAFATLK